MLTVIGVAKPIYEAPPFTGYADPAEEDRHEELIEAAGQHGSTSGEVLLEASCDVLAVR